MVRVDYRQTPEDEVGECYDNRSSFLGISTRSKPERLPQYCRVDKTAGLYRQVSEGTKVLHPLDPSEHIMCLTFSTD